MTERRLAGGLRGPVRSCHVQTHVVWPALRIAARPKGAVATRMLVEFRPDGCPRPPMGNRNPVPGRRFTSVYEYDDAGRLMKSSNRAHRGIG